MSALLNTSFSHSTCTAGGLKVDEGYASSLQVIRTRAYRYKRTCEKLHLIRSQAGQNDVKKGKVEQRTLLDNASNLLTNLLNQGTLTNMPVAEGAVSDLFGRPLFFALYDWFIEHGPVYKLAFGPKAFVVISDPVVARHILRENAFGYDKGVLADILEPIMGKGLIPADLDTWKVRRRAIVPGFHTAYLEAMVNVFSQCTARAVKKFETMLLEAEAKQSDDFEVDMEQEYSSLALDIIGLSVFNYDFECIAKMSPVIQAVYGTLYEAEHRSTFYIPYWKLPFASLVVPRQRKFQEDLKVINDCLDGLIKGARETRQEEDIEALQQRDYSKVKDASLLRFLVDMRGEDADDRQLRDDLMTMLIAGHETTAAVLTWATFMLAQNPEKVMKAQEEVDNVLKGRVPTWEDIRNLRYIRLIVAEALRLYPQPPLLIRRSLQPDTLPGGFKGDPNGYVIPKGVDLFISVYNLHRSPYYWDNPEKFEPERFLEEKSGDDIEGWGGFDPKRGQNSLYANEVMADFAFLPFGGGPRKCVGDQFALMESTIALVMVMQKFNFELRGSPEDVELVTGATLHTKSGLWCKLKRRPNICSNVTSVARDSLVVS
ncbi:hypothetical protein GOP47_0023642 [Adiantum capillus-veneris]|uniref:Cytochrome P450 n=1 Tax=Adiantum capillus-veneris TaxID=13818 RepID=A0A9D4U4Y3_ADICA|nr:hypothetical protein GOP47_0023642 [Adiantum capillus-veneris]